MKTNVCNICGGNLINKKGKWVCEACGAFAPEEITSEESNLLYMASQKLRMADFDDAEKCYLDITIQYPSNCDAYWGLVLSQYGIRYEKDYDGKMIHTCFKTSYESLYDNSNFKKACELASVDQKNFYLTQAEKIEKTRIEWVEKASKEPPYDIFLSYKATELNECDKKTEDYYEAREIFNELSKLGYKVFFSQESLADKTGEHYEPYIFNALNTCHMMLVYASKPEYVNSTWVRNEWNRYYKKIKNKEKPENSLVLIYKGFNPEKELCQPFSITQNLDRNDLHFIENLQSFTLRVISEAKKVIPKIQFKPIIHKEIEENRKIQSIKKRVFKEKTPINNGIFEKVEVRDIGTYSSPKLTVTLEKQLQVGYSLLKNELFEDSLKLFDEVLVKNKTNGNALLGKLLAQNKCTSLDDFFKKDLTFFDDFDLLKNVIDFGDTDTSKALLEHCSRLIDTALFQCKIPTAYKFYLNIAEYNVEIIQKHHLSIFEMLLKLNHTDDVWFDFIDIVLKFVSIHHDSYIECLNKLIDFLILLSEFTKAEIYLDKLYKCSGDSIDYYSYKYRIANKSKDIENAFLKIINSDGIKDIEQEANCVSQEIADFLFSKLSEIFVKNIDTFQNAYRTFEVISKYDFSKIDFLVSKTIEFCINNPKEQNNSLFELAILCCDCTSTRMVNYLFAYAKSYLKKGDFLFSKRYINYALEYDHTNQNLLKYLILISIGCTSEDRAYLDIHKFSDFVLLENVLGLCHCDEDVASTINYYVDLIVKSIKSNYFSTESLKVFEELIKYFPKSTENSLIKALYNVADSCKEIGAFEKAEQLYSTITGIDSNEYKAFWSLLQAKLHCKNDNELIRQKIEIQSMYEFNNALLAATKYPDVLNSYIDVRVKQEKWKDNLARKERMRKKIRKISLISSICLITLISFSIALAKSISFYNRESSLIYEYDQDKDGYYVSAGSLFKNECIYIDSYYNNKEIIGFSENAFLNNTKVKAIYYPYNLKAIKDNAFSGCTNLEIFQPYDTYKETLSIKHSTNNNANSSLKEIGINAFRNCSSLTYFYFGPSITQIYAHAFENSGIKNCFIKGNVKTIQESTFEGCKNLCNVTLNNELINIDSRAFYGCSFKYISIPKSVIYIGDKVFANNSELSQIDLPDRESLPEWRSLWDTTNNATIILKLEVFYDFDGGYAPDDKTSDNVYYNTNFNLCVPTKKGYSFNGWFTGRDGSGTRLTDNKGQSLEPWTIPSSCILHAHWVPNDNQLIFDGNGATSGSMPIQVIKTNGSIRLTKNKFQKVGYSFSGWSAEPNSSVIFNDEDVYTMGTSSENYLFAKWSPLENKIVFDGNGATSGSMPNQLMFTDSFSCLNTNQYVKNGYEFIGWSLSKSGDVDYQNNAIFNMGFSEETILYAVWKPISYTISYSLNGGFCENIGSYTIESEDFQINNPIKEGYEFDGWTGSNISGKTKMLTIKQGTFGNLEYSATYIANENQIIFNGNGATSGSMDNQIAKTDEEIILNKNAFIKDHYTFIGWSSKENGNVEYRDYDDFKMGASKFFTLYAIWKPISYDISFDLDGGIMEERNNYTIEDNDFSLNTPSKEGYIFNGWTGTGLTEKTMNVTIFKGSFGDRFYKACWTPKTNQIIFNGNGATSGYMQNLDIKSDETKQILPNNFYKDGYAFKGWAMSENGPVVYEECDMINIGIENTCTLYAVWNPNENSIVLDYNNGSSFKDFISATTDETINLPSLSREGNAGYHLIGWSTSKDGDIEYVANGEYVVNTQKVQTLYAIWDANSNHVVFNANHGGGKMDDQIIKYGDTVSLKLNEFDDSAGTFAGWATSPDGDIEYLNGDLYTMGPNASYILYAKWVPIEISTISDFKSLDSKPNASFVLKNDIDFSNETLQPQFALPDKTFKGIFDGNGYSLKNFSLVYSQTELSDYGLFGYIEGGEIINTVIENPHINVSSINCGILAGHIDKNSSIKNVSIFSSTSSSDSDDYNLLNFYKGGLLVGESDGEIINCFASGNVKGYLIGGIVGKATINSKISGCSCQAYISSTICGGIVGFAENNCIVKCSFNGSLYINSNVDDVTYVGGIAGIWHNKKTNQNLILKECFASGSFWSRRDVESTGFGDTYCGGLVAEMCGNVNISSCYVTGSVTSERGGNYVTYAIYNHNIGGTSYCGGMIGNYSFINSSTSNEINISKCYVSASLKSESYAYSTSHQAYASGLIYLAYNSSYITTIKASFNVEKCFIDCTIYSEYGYGANLKTIGTSQLMMAYFEGNSSFSECYFAIGTLINNQQISEVDNCNNSILSIDRTVLQNIEFQKLLFNDEDIWTFEEGKYPVFSR